MKLQLTCLILLVCLCTAVGQISTERPGNSDSPTTIPKGAIQVEAGTQATFLGETYRETVLPNLLVRVALSGTVEFRLLTNLVKTPATLLDKFDYGMTDLALSGKVWLSEWEKSNLSFIGYLGVPTGNGSRDDYSYQGRFSFGHSISESVGLLTNVGYNYDGTDGDILYTLVISKSAGSAGFFAELYGNSDDLFADTGVTYAIKDNLQVDCSFGVGITQKANNYIGMGVAWLFQ